MKKVVLYARSAAGDQSLNDQIRSMRDALDPETKVAEIVTDQAPASAPQRPSLQQALDYFDQHDGDALMVHSVDSLARTVRELSELQSLLQDRGLEFPKASDIPNEI